MTRLVIMICVALFFTQEALADAKRPVKHPHHGKYHTHILPNNGVGSHNHGGRKASSNIRKTTQRPVKHPHQGKYHTHVLPNNGVGSHNHGGLRASNNTKKIPVRNNAPQKLINASNIEDRNMSKISSQCQPSPLTNYPSVYRHKVTPAAKLREMFSGSMTDKRTSFNVDSYFHPDGSYFYVDSNGLVRKGVWVTALGKVCMKVPLALSSKSFHYNVTDMKSGKERASFKRVTDTGRKFGSGFRNEYNSYWDRWVLEYYASNAEHPFVVSYRKQSSERERKDHNLKRKRQIYQASQSKNTDLRKFHSSLLWDKSSHDCNASIPIHFLKDTRVFKLPIERRYIKSWKFFNGNCGRGYRLGNDVVTEITINPYFKQVNSWNSENCYYSGCDKTYLRSPIILSIRGKMVDGVYEGRIRVRGENRAFFDGRTHNINMGKNAKDQIFSQEFFDKDMELYASRGRFFYNHKSYVDSGLTTANSLSKNITVIAEIEDRNSKKVAGGSASLGSFNLVKNFDRRTTDFYSTLTLKPKNPSLFRGKKLAVTVQFLLEFKMHTNMDLGALKTGGVTQYVPVEKEYTFTLSKENNWSASKKDLFLEGLKESTRAEAVGFRVWNGFVGFGKNEIYIKSIREL